MPSTEALLMMELLPAFRRKGSAAIGLFDTSASNTMLALPRSHGRQCQESLTAANQPDPGTFRGEGQGDVTSNTAAGTWDKGNLILEAGAHGGDSLAAAEDRSPCILSAEKSTEVTGGRLSP